MPLIQWIMQNLQSGRVQGSATLIGDSSVVAVAKVTWHAITVIDGDSSINATAKVTPHPAPQPQFDRYSLGVTYGPPGGGGFGIRQSKRSILIKFTFAGNTYSYEHESGNSFIALTGLSHKKQKANAPLIKLEAMKHGQNYHLQE